MQTTLQQYKPFLLFLGKFLLTYLFLIFLYQLYLDSFDKATFEPDGMTTLVARQSTAALEFVGYAAHIQPRHGEPSYTLFLDGKSIVRIVEGCNAISVMILFVAFVVAFSSRWLSTVLFVLAGLLLVHALNIVRIVLLILGYRHYPEQAPMLHDIVFPLFIYGVVFILWVIWINKFSKYAKNIAKQ